MKKALLVGGGILLAVVLIGGVAALVRTQSTGLSVGSEEPILQHREGSVGGEPLPGGIAELDAAGGSVGAEDEGLAAEVAPLPSGERVIKTASVEVRVEEGFFDEGGFQEAAQVAASLGGFVASSSTQQVDERIASGTLVIRVPAERFDEAIKTLKGFGELVSEERQGQDVTQEFVDLEARIRHLRSQEAFLLRLMDRAESISDMLQIQSQLSSVQLQIEQIQGRLQFLEDRTELATITARLFEPVAASAAPKGLAKAWQEALDAFRTVIAGFVVAMGWIAPFALLAGAGMLGWRIWRRPKTAAVAGE